MDFIDNLDGLDVIKETIIYSTEVYVQTLVSNDIYE